MAKKFGAYVVAAIVAIGALALSEKPFVPAPSSIVSSAEARIGRPLTPMSVAGVARRTARRCAAGIYYC